ncbi:hypothetical protein Ciccas_008285 [Cichlidogyrus casuarinus]|uniref:Uncharacterized protein n=1 Tax=Cichlidogyrus casuarinus TaxID=1844966 RepID=A0ABD2Q0E5_9PLAT
METFRRAEPDTSNYLHLMVDNYEPDKKDLHLACRTEPKTPLTSVLSEKYNLHLAQYHTFIVRKSVGAVCYMPLGSCGDIREKIKKSQLEKQPDLTEEAYCQKMNNIVIPNLRNVYQVSQNVLANAKCQQDMLNIP